ncbi:MAG: hypothetical protein KF845_08910 [Cyclobacteriaceae bacterium]|nr:hypothetical protein [Cyclobacteriaceae bacterium]
MKNILLFLTLIALTVSCYDDFSTIPQTSTDRIREELSLFIKNELKQKQSTNEKLTPEIINFMETKFNYQVIEKDSDMYTKKLSEYVHNSRGIYGSARTEDYCEVDVTLITNSSLAPECWVFVIEYGSGCTHEGCIENDWLCGSGGNYTWNNVIIC